MPLGMKKVEKDVLAHVHPDKKRLTEVSGNTSDNVTKHMNIGGTITKSRLHESPVRAEAMDMGTGTGEEEYVVAPGCPHWENVAVEKSGAGTGSHSVCPTT